MDPVNELPKFPLFDQLPTMLKLYILDFWWDEQKLQALDLPAVTLDVSSLLWHFELPFWQHSGVPFQVTPRQVWDNPAKYAAQYARTLSSDLACPIVVRLQDDRHVIMDGLHRLMKAAIQNNQTIQAKICREDLFPLIAHE